MTTHIKVTLVGAALVLAAVTGVGLYVANKQGASADVVGDTATVTGTGVITGKVTRGGSPVVDASVGISGPSGSLGVTVLDDGTYYFTDLAAGEYAISEFDAASSASVDKTITVEEGATATLNFEL